MNYPLRPPKKIGRFHITRTFVSRMIGEAFARTALIRNHAATWSQANLASMREFIFSLRTKLSAEHAQIPIMRAKSWLWYDRTRVRTTPWLRRYTFKAALLTLGLAIVCSMLLATHFEVAVQPYFTPERLARLSTLLVTVGGALVGATAIAFSVVVFSVQINVERTPDGLFQTLSRDQRLIVAFVATLVMSVTGAALSLIADAGYVARTSVAAIWIVILVPSLIVYA
jgi:hypothetical protein